MQGAALPPCGAALPVLLFLHYSQIIRYEEVSLARQFGGLYAAYEARVPRLLPDRQSLRRLRRAVGEFSVNRDGLRHNALYLLFIPGFLLSAATGKLLWAVAVGLPAVVDWAVVHTKIGTAGESSPSAPKDESGPMAASRPPRVFRSVLYAQCWEDPEIDRKAFNLSRQDSLFSITSGGCNVLAFLVDDPGRVIALDLNPRQNHLLRLKMAAFRKLPYRSVLEFLGFRASSLRLETYAVLRPLLEAHPRRAPVP